MLENKSLLFVSFCASRNISSIEEIATALEGEIESNAPDFANDSIDLLPPIFTSVFDVKSNKSL